MKRGRAVGEGVRPFFCYYGGKWRDTPRLYPPPAHATIVEPFAGSAGYSLRYPDRDVVLIERDPVIAAVWRYIIGVTASEVLALPDVPAMGSADDLNVPQEARWLIGLWLNKGASRPRKRPSSWMRSGIRPGSFWGDRVRQTIAAQLDRIRHWTLIEGDFQAAPMAPATWFVDPPYALAGEHYVHGSSGIDYEALGRWCRALPGQVIACENEGAGWLPFEPLANTKTARKGRRSKEVAWMRPKPDRASQLALPEI